MRGIRINQVIALMEARFEEGVVWNLVARFEGGAAMGKDTGHQGAQVLRARLAELSQSHDLSVAEKLAVVEEASIRSALDIAAGDRRKAAKVCGIPQSSFYRRLKRYPRLLEGKRLLVIDDDMRTLRSFARVLCRLCKVETEASGQGARKRLKSSSYDGVLCDYFLEHETGVELYCWAINQKLDVIEHFALMSGAPQTTPAPIKVYDKLAGPRALLEKLWPKTFAADHHGVAP